MLSEYAYGISLAQLRGSSQGLHHLAVEIETNMVVLHKKKL